MYAPLFAYIAITCLIAATGIYTFEQVENVIEGGELHDLGVIANAKVAQVTSWRENQLRIGEALFRDPSLATEFEQWQQAGMRGNVSKRNLVRLLTELQHANEDKTFLLLDRQGKVKVAVSENYVLSDEESLLARQAMQGGKVLFSDFHRNDAEGNRISIDLAVPLTVMPEKRVVGAMVLQIDPYKFLYPSIQSGISPDSSVETLLMRREGDEVLILNELRHAENSEQPLRVPISATNQIAVMAIRGETGTADGLDYRGIPVVAGLRAIPGSAWFMATKIDKDELFAPIYRLKTWTLFLGVMFAAFVGGLLIFWLKGVRMQHRLLVAQRDAAIERERLVKHFEYLSKYASDIILVADETGRIVDVNERALETFGYSRDEFLRMAIADLRLPTEDSAVINGQIEQIKARGELRYEAIVRRKDGTTLPVEVSMRLIEVQGIKYLQGIGRDITERRSIEEHLRQSEALLKESQRMARIGSWELD
ncbi:MAG TPA: PAS domain S-box protein, partial [Gallionella sp.]|nr:PAS domain S-box protein [Gallionella sp.]